MDSVAFCAGFSDATGPLACSCLRVLLEFDMYSGIRCLGHLWHRVNLFFSKRTGCAPDQAGQDTDVAPGPRACEQAAGNRLTANTPDAKTRRKLGAHPYSWGCSSACSSNRVFCLLGRGSRGGGGGNPAPLPEVSSLKIDAIKYSRMGWRGVPRAPTPLKAGGHVLTHLKHLRKIRTWSI